MKAQAHLVIVALVLSGIAASAAPAGERTRIFDGKTFAGWEGNREWFRIEDGAIVGGRLTKRIPRNEFLCTTKEYADFELRLKLKLVDDKGNAGIQIRSRRIPDHHEMIGYQADVSRTFWGGLYDESRRRKMLAKPDPATLAKAVKAGQWNEYVIRCEGKRIRLWLNGVQTVDYTEPDPKIPQTGIIGLQIHGGPASEVWYKDIEIEELSAPARPNLIVIMVDDMGYAGLSCFGNPYFKTPEMDRLAAEGMRLTDFHSSGTVCSPTRAGLLTGRYQQRAGIEAVIHPRADHPEHRKGLRESEVTFAEVLKKAGYTTGLIGKWHQGYPHNSDAYHPQNHGFDEFVGYHSGNIDFISHVGDHVKHDWWHGRKETREEGYSTHLINKYALQFIERNQDRPFCLYIAHEAIHNPVQVPGDPVRRSEEHGWKRWKPTNQAERIEKYKGMTLPIDEGVGQIRKTLEKLGLDRKTFVLLFSDNGPAGDFPSGSPTLRGGKGTVYEGGHRVPAIAWWPGRIQGDTKSDTPAISIDVMPTILALAGVEAPNQRPLDGVDLSPVLLKQQPLPARPLFWASMSNNGARSEAMREGPWKLVVNHPKAKPGTFDNEKVALYRLDTDPSEASDLAARQPERTADMLQRLKAWFADTQKTATPQPGGWLQQDEASGRG